MFRVTHVEEEGGEIHVAMLMLAINCADEEEAFKMTPQHPLATLLLSCTRFFSFFRKRNSFSPASDRFVDCGSNFHPISNFPYFF